MIRMPGLSNMSPQSTRQRRCALTVIRAAATTSDDACETDKQQVSIAVLLDNFLSASEEMKAAKHRRALLPCVFFSFCLRAGGIEGGREEGREGGREGGERLVPRGLAVACTSSQRADSDAGVV